MAGAGNDVLPPTVAAIDCLVRVVRRVECWPNCFQTTAHGDCAPRVGLWVGILVDIFWRETVRPNWVQHCIWSSGHGARVDHIFKSVFARGSVAMEGIRSHASTIREEHQVTVLSAEVNEAGVSQQPLVQVTYVQFDRVHDPVHVTLRASQTSAGDRVAGKPFTRVVKVDGMPGVRICKGLWSICGSDGASAQVPVTCEFLENQNSVGMH